MWISYKETNNNKIYKQIIYLKDRITHSFLNTTTIHIINYYYGSFDKWSIKVGDA